ncbi:MAG: hypothetical protein ACJ8GN_15195 [Longimicrobiaceae bacterium]
MMPGKVDMGVTDLVAAAETLRTFSGKSLTHRIRRLEKAFAGASGPAALDLNAQEGVSSPVLQAAAVVKVLAGQINVLIHAVGILRSLPKILEPGETVEYLSLGAGNTGRSFDLETTQRVAEFKFIHWRGGSEAIRQNVLFKDFYLLAEKPTPKDKYLYVVGLDEPQKFLRGKRKLTSILSRNDKLLKEFTLQYGDRFVTVGEYFTEFGGKVKLVDLTPFMPELSVLNG